MWPFLVIGLARLGDEPFGIRLFVDLIMIMLSRYNHNHDEVNKSQCVESDQRNDNVTMNLYDTAQFSVCQV